MPLQSASRNIAAESPATPTRRSTANTQRGRSADDRQQAAILEAARALEALNPTASPGTSPLINGRWSLLYQGGAEEQENYIKAPLEHRALLRPGRTLPAAAAVSVWGVACWTSNILTGMLRCFLPQGRKR